MLRVEHSDSMVEVAAWEWELGMYCIHLAEGTVFDLASDKLSDQAERKVVDSVLVGLGLVAWVVGESMSAGGTFLQWRCWCERDSRPVAK